MRYVISLRVRIGPCLQLAGFDLLYAISAGRSVLCWVIHDVFDGSSIVVSTTIESLVLSRYSCRLRRERGSAEGFALCAPSLKLLSRIETPKIRGTIVIMSRR